MRSLTSSAFQKTTGITEANSPEKDYVYYWQLWHHNWDDHDLQVVQDLCSLQGSRVLEVGCGDGRMTFGLADYCNSITGVDIDERFIGLAKGTLKAVNAKNIEFLTMDAQELVLSDESFDVVLFPWVLQMVNAPIKAVLEAYRVLKPGGEIIVIGLRSDADYDKIISNFVADTATINPNACYENPIGQVFGSDSQRIALRMERQFDYFFESLEIAQEAFVFALDRWYSTKIDIAGQERLRNLLGHYLLDDNRVRLQFPSSIYLARKKQ